MRSQIYLGRVFGIRIGLHYSWFLIAFLISSSLFSDFHLRHPEWAQGLVLVLSIATSILFFVSLLLHELSHSLVAQARGLPVTEITLFALGGVSQIGKEASKAKDEFWISFVGPLTSAVIGLICVGAVKLVPGVPGPGLAMLSWLGYINLALAVFNLVPGYPLDGGRILRAIVWWKTNDVDRSTRTAARVGQVVAILFIGAGMIEFFSGAGFGGLWTAFIGWFLMQASTDSYVQTGLRHSLEGVHVSDLMKRDCPTVDGYTNVRDFVDNELMRTGRRCFVVVENGDVAGLVTPNEIKHIDKNRWPYTTLDDVMRPLGEMGALKPDATLASAIEVLGRDETAQVPVVSDGHLEGVLSRDEIVNYLRTRSELQK